MSAGRKWLSAEVPLDARPLDVKDDKARLGVAGI